MTSAWRQDHWTSTQFVRCQGGNAAFTVSGKQGWIYWFTPYNGDGMVLHLTNFSYWPYPLDRW